MTGAASAGIPSRRLYADLAGMVASRIPRRRSAASARRRATARRDIKLDRNGAARPRLALVVGADDALDLRRRCFRRSKTPGLNVTVRALNRIEKENSALISARRLAHETQAQKAKEVAKKWREDRETALKSTRRKSRAHAD